MQVIFDTGSDWLVIESHKCYTCLKNKYNHELSSKWQNITNLVTEHLYGSARLYGFNVKDKVSLDR